MGAVMLFLIDCDFTLVNIHTHNKAFELVRSHGGGIEPADFIDSTKGRAPLTSVTMDNLDGKDNKYNQLWERVKKANPQLASIGPAKEWKLFIECALEAGHKIAIVSFNALHMPYFVLRDIIQLQPSILRNPDFCIVSYLPKNTRLANKNEHIATAKHAVRFSGAVDCILIDDSLRNCNEASQAGIVDEFFQVPEGAPAFYEGHIRFMQEKVRAAAMMMPPTIQPQAAPAPSLAS